MKFLFHVHGYFHWVKDFESKEVKVETLSVFRVVP
jgi:hypothetical protein